VKHIRFLLLFVALVSPAGRAQSKVAPELNHDPDKALITANDVRLFWAAYDLWLSRDHGAPDKLASVLQHEYLDKGSDGVKDFIPNRIVSADHLANFILGHRSYYEAARHNTEQMESFIPPIRKNFLAFKRLYPDASFPAVYFVIGAQNSGGTSSGNALIIGSEMFGEGKAYLEHLPDVVPLVIHELTHFQQKYPPGNDLFHVAMREGAADFVAELVSGRHIDEETKPYGDSHEEELWRQFQQDVRSGGKIGDWMYVFEPKDGKPRDLGYYMGYKICQSYYQISRDKQLALKTIIEMRSPDDILANSAYEKRFN
jgi:hypothetical protein